ncbi:hypothetical protein TWF730_008301 [Orbilia blumenaviensis]|uniref:Nucleoside phosphorylase domain-containing protein n=1 Tax=Orbilia blumenaviensis TaxID=1796055 RepID=A0AAV9V5T1_9PEZI
MLPEGNAAPPSSFAGVQPDSKPRSVLEYTVGWICALPKEQTAARALLDHIHPDPEPPIPDHDKNTYILGSMGDHNIAITCLPKGKVGTNEAAVAATEMLRTFSSIRIGFMVGIGGGIPPRVRLGDVVVGTPVGIYPGVVQWDFGKEEGTGFKQTGALNNPPSVLLKALTKLETLHDSEGTQIPMHMEILKKKWPSLAKYTWSESLEDPLCTTSRPDQVSWATWFLSLLYIFFSWLGGYQYTRQGRSTTSSSPTLIAKRKPGEVSVHYGLIASGNKVIKTAELRENLKKSLGGDLLCVEMEAAGLMNFPCLVVRGICDYADSRKNDVWQEYAAAIAGAFTKELLGHIRPSSVKQESPIGEILDQRQSPLQKFLIL